MNTEIKKTRRGRPPKSAHIDRDTKAELIRSGLAHLTENGFVASGIDKILKDVGVPKGSFYFYFASKEAFGHAVLDNYAQYFENKLHTWLHDQNICPLQRLQNFVNDAEEGMRKHAFKRGCLVGNLGQEVDAIPASFRAKLLTVFEQWQLAVGQCLREAQHQGKLSQSADCDDLAEVFWTGWEGAVSRARLEQSEGPLQKYCKFFIQGLPK